MKTLLTTISCFITLSIASQNNFTQNIDSIIESTIQKNDPGLMIGVVRDGQIIYEKYYGLANLSHKIKMDKNTRCNIASTAKQFTALMILKLSLENKLSLEDDIRKFIPELYTNVKEAIKIRHLINHTSGIREYIGLMDLQNKAWWTRVGLDNDDVLELLKKQEDLGFNPGSKYVYSNSNYNILAKIIEKVTQQKFKVYAKEFFKSLGMENTAFPKGYMTVIPNKAEAYSDWGGGEWYEDIKVTKTAGEGFLFTTLKDQLMYEQAIQNAKDSNNQLLIKSQLPIENSEIKSYGFGLRLFNWFYGPHKAVHHDGGTYGYKSQTVRFTDQNLSIFVMTNNGKIGTDDMADQIAKVFLPPAEIKETSYADRYFEPIKNINPLVNGQYRSQKGQLIRIENEKGKTYFKRGNLKIELIKEKNHLYHPDYNNKQKIIFYDNEMVLFDTDGTSTQFKRINTPLATVEDLNILVGTYHNSELNISLSLRLSEENILKVKFSTKSMERDVEVLNRIEMQSRNFLFKVERDLFDRPNNLLVSLGRALNIKFVKKTNLKFQPQIKTESGSIQVTTIGSRNGNTSDILLTKNYDNGNEEWSKRLGGNSWDKASSIISTKDGYLIVGSTSSYGVGNYDFYVIKVDKKGQKIWQNTYGKSNNDYAYSVEKVNEGYIIKGTTQLCNSKDVLNRTCTTNVWFVNIDEKGNELSNTVLEEIKSK
ncbi:MAG: beta-lactamase family protein [Winogradskyella sp.]|uniref:serine hydrolase domain-containing protein n=1 Tax=Winogradskyella sp. TaxID=1883156 RepID=UPI0025E62262|nr:serine hydrolase domain-containing protein [Winogradskyella sp.]NRB60717.1 beta-lactamase family protein [Winogradskyella sp.]